MTPTLPTLLQECAGREIRLTAHGEQLTIDGPKEALTSELIEALETHKPALLAYLRTGEIILDAQTATVADVQYALEFFKSSRIGNSGAVLSHKQKPFQER